MSLHVRKCVVRRYETSAEEDRALLSGVPPGSRKHKAILVRLCHVLFAPLYPHGGSRAACMCVLHGCGPAFHAMP